MSYHQMTSREINAFINSQPARPAILSTVREGGEPHCAPIWIALDETGDILFNTGSKTVKGKNLARTGRAAICVQDDTAPFSFVSIEGTVTLVHDLAEVGLWATIIGGRYMGDERSEEFGARNAVEGELLVGLRPERRVSAAEISS